MQNSDLFLTELTYLLALIPLPVYNFVCFTSILFIYAFDYTGVDLGLTVLLMVSLTSLVTWQGCEPRTSRTESQRVNHYATEPN